MENVTEPENQKTEVDFNSAAVIENPFPFLATIRQSEPVHWNNSIKGWCITAYEDVCNSSTDRRFSAQRIQPFLDNQSAASDAELRELSAVYLLWLPFLDPPTHTRLRKLLLAGFTRRSIAHMEPKIVAIVKQLIGKIDDQDSMDMIEAFAAPLPSMVIADILGVPVEHVPLLKKWSDDISAFVLGSRLMENKYTIAAKATAQMKDYFSELIEARRSQPGDAILDDLIASHDGEDHLTIEELLSSCILLLFAGHETTSQLFGNGALALLQHTQQLEDLHANIDDKKIVANAIEEILRWNGPTLATVRVMSEAVELHNTTLEAGNRVHLFNAAANRDPRVFINPDKFDIRRKNANKQINFGYGIHLCLGAQLARMEANIAFPMLIEALKGWELADGRLEWLDTLINRGLKALPLRRR